MKFAYGQLVKVSVKEVFLFLQIIHLFVTVWSSERRYSYDHQDHAEERFRPHYALNYQNGVRLAAVEVELFLKLKDILLTLKSESSSPDKHCLFRLEKYLEDFKKDATSMKVLEDLNIGLNVVPDHPLLLYRMIRRLFVTLGGEVMADCAHNEEIIKIIDETFPAEMPIPSTFDFEDALLGLLRLHYVYGFNATSEFRLGIFGNIHTNVTLNIYDCLALGNYAMDKGAHVLAYQWLSSAELSLPEVKSTKELEESSTDLSKSWERLLEYSTVQTMELMHNLYREGRQETWSKFHPYSTYATCREEPFLTEAEKSMLTCYLENQAHPYFYINPIKIEFLERGAPVIQFHDFISDKTISYIREKTYPTLTRSGVVSFANRRTEFSNYRTSLQSWIYDDLSQRPDPEMMALNKRIQFLTGFQVLKPGSSHALQVVSYSSLGGHYDFHDDALDNEILTHENGDRIATFFMFLSDVTFGGNTGFSKLGVYAKPIKGSAIIWFNLMRNGSPDIYSTHGKKN